MMQQSLRRMVERIFSGGLHHKQVTSLGMLAVGVLHASVLGVAAVGTAMARAFAKIPKHGIKQLDRYLSNRKVRLLDIWTHLIPVLAGPRRRLLISMDWTEFDADDHSTLGLAMITRGKRTIPLVWVTVKKSTLKGRQKSWERMALMALLAAVPKTIQVIIVADRGFGDVQQYDFINDVLGFDFVIRYRQQIHVMYRGAMTPSSALVPRRGQVRVIRDTRVTHSKEGPYTVVLCKASGMKAPWCLATSLQQTTGREVVRIYSRRFQCEETFRDLKDRRYGYGLRFTRIKDAGRRDRFILLFALTYILQTVVGVGSERLGLDKELRANTETRRTHSLFRQGRALLGEVDRDTYVKLRQQLLSLLSLLFTRGIWEVIS